MHEVALTSPPLAAELLRTYVVNLKRRPDRRYRMQRLLPPDLDAVFTSDWPVEFDGHRLTRRSLELAGYRVFPWQITSENMWWSRPLKLGEIGCTVAHLSCWRDAARFEAEPYVMILEDDVSFEPAFLERLLMSLEQLRHARRHFDLLYLGRYPLGQDRRLTEDLVIPGYSHCTFGYLLSRPGLAILLAQRLDLALVPIDEFLPSLYVDHPREDLRRRYPRRLRALAFDPPLVRQLPKEEAGSDTEDSDFLGSE